MLLGEGSVMGGGWYGVVKLCGDGVVMCDDVLLGCSVVCCKAYWCRCACGVVVWSSVVL